MDFAKKAVLEGAALLQSNEDYDWLGPGAYFWESNPKRALEWANWKVSKGDYKRPAVIGAVIDLGNCLDLTSHEDIELVRYAHASFIKIQQRSGLRVPENVSPRGMKDKDRVLRFLDCAVFRHLHEIVKDVPELLPFDSVRGMFAEGGRAYPGSGIHRKSHIQVAVRSNNCIKGVFFPNGMDDLPAPSG